MVKKLKLSKGGELSIPGIASLRQVVLATIF
jgi:hypothetical protein